MVGKSNDDARIVNHVIIRVFQCEKVEVIDEIRDKQGKEVQLLMPFALK